MKIGLFFVCLLGLSSVVYGNETVTLKIATDLQVCKAEPGSIYCTVQTPDSPAKAEVIELKAVNERKYWGRFKKRLRYGNYFYSFQVDIYKYLNNTTTYSIKTSISDDIEVHGNQAPDYSAAISSMDVARLWEVPAMTLYGGIIHIENSADKLVPRLFIQGQK